jgi:hypothetical protein
MIWKPHPPPLPEWEPHVVRMYLSVCSWIDECRVQMKDGITPIPFLCYLCHESRTDFSFLSGDGVPICSRCCPHPDADEREPTTHPTTSHPFESDP